MKIIFDKWFFSRQYVIKNSKKYLWTLSGLAGKRIWKKCNNIVNTEYIWCGGSRHMWFFKVVNVFNMKHYWLIMYHLIEHFDQNGRCGKLIDIYFNQEY